MTADPALGSYLSTSGANKSINIYTPQNLALYHYGWNNPARFIDPSGALPDDANNQAGPAIINYLKSSPDVWAQLMVANNLKPRQLQDAALAGTLTTGIQPKQNFMGVLGEAIFRAGYTKNIPFRTVWKSLNPFQGVPGTGIPDLVSFTPHGPNEQLNWFNCNWS